MTDRNVVIRLRGDISDLQAKMVAAGRSVAATTDKITGASKESKKWRDGLSSVGDTAGKVGLVAGAALTGIVASSANFEQAMSNVQAATHESAANMDLLRTAAIKAGAETKFSATEAAAAVENLAKAGVSTTDVLNGGLAGAMSLAAAGSMDVADAAETAATAMTQFGLQGTQVPHIADLLAAAAGKAQGDVSDFAMALKQGGLVANQTGLSIEETTGALGAFASAGLIGSDAGTSFKTMLQALTPTSAKAKKVMGELGISAYNSQGQFIGLANFAGKLQGALQDMSAEQQNATLKTIFGSDAVRAASVLYKEGATGIQDWINKVNDQGYAAETAAIKMDNLRGDLEQLKGSLETTLIGAGSGSQGPLRQLTQGATKAVNALNGLPDQVKNTGTALLALTAITGGGAWFGAKAVAGVTSMRNAMVSLGLASEGTAISLRSVGAAAGVVAGITFTGIGTLDMMDSAKRSREAADVTAKSIGDLQTALQNSNVGKYADDLGIDISKLAQDLAVYGEKGAYAAEVQAKLAESGHGVGAMFKAIPGTVIPGYTSATEKASDANSDLYKILKNNKDALGQGQSALDGAADAAGSLGDAAGDATTGVDDLSGSLDDASKQAYTLQNAMDLLFGKVDVDAALISWRRSLAGLSKELKGGDNALSQFTKTGQDNRDKIRGQIDSLRTWAEAQYNVDGSSKKLTDRLLNGRNAIIKQGEAAGISRGEMVKYLHALGLTPKEIRTDVKLIGAQPALDQVKAVRQALYNLDGTVSEVYIRTNRESKVTGQLGGEPKVATGGYITGPGSGTSDSIPAWLSNGEYVIKAAAVAKYGVDTLHRINAMRFASGGYVNRAVSAQAASSTTNYYGAQIDYGQLAKAISGMRQLYGDVHVHGDGSFRRALEQDQMAEAVGGFNFGG